MKPAQIYPPSVETGRDQPPGTLKIATLNIAHGRGRAVHQGLLSKRKITENLNAIAELLSNQEYDLIALQEVDEPSVWSSSVNQLDHLNSSLEIYTGIHGIHVQRFKLHYGTALLTRLPVLSTLVHTYPSSAPLPPKGFTSATLKLPGISKPLLVLSLHLDPIRPAIRLKQAEDIITIVDKHDGPTIILGDFNDVWHSAQSVVYLLSHELDLTAYEPQRSDLYSFRFIAKRIDWILCSKEFSFVDYGVDTTIVSDHYLVKATVNYEGVQ